MFVVYVLVFYVLCVVLCVCLCTGHFVMEPLNLTFLHCLKHLFNLYLKKTKNFLKNILLEKCTYHTCTQYVLLLLLRKRPLNNQNIDNPSDNNNYDFIKTAPTKTAVLTATMLYKGED